MAKGWTNSLGVTVTKGCIEANVILVLARVQISRLGLYFYEEGDLSLELHTLEHLFEGWTCNLNYFDVSVC